MASTVVCALTDFCAVRSSLAAISMFSNRLRVGRGLVYGPDPATHNQAYAGWEDAAVPPDELGDDLRGFGALPIKMYGDELVAAFKDLWDSDNKMNPGKVIRPPVLSASHTEEEPITGQTVGLCTCPSFHGGK